MTQLPITREERATVRADAAAGDEAALIARVASRDQGAFESLYRAYYPRLRHFLLGMMRRSSLIEDVLDETMLVVWRKARTYNHASRLSTWIFAIAYRQSLKALRHGGDVLEHADADHLHSPGRGPDDELQRQQVSGRLQAAIAALSAEHRAVIELTYYQGYACREIAAIMHCPVDTVKTRMFYARRRLKTLLVTLREDVP
ncbi:MAG TPA: sigma-70 family RNA polymerase sigma factor [Rhodanobacteraceae bacterium]|nr:sigma-70 family RNA polymerase sigma factor [Rhodanobacteraceae bacterium]